MYYTVFSVIWSFYISICGYLIVLILQCLCHPGKHSLLFGRQVYFLIFITLKLILTIYRTCSDSREYTGKSCSQTPVQIGQQVDQKSAAATLFPCPSFYMLTYLGLYHTIIALYVKVTKILLYWHEKWLYVHLFRLSKT